MAWIESHQTLLTHRKTGRASRALGVSKITVIGHLHVLWWWCLDNAQDGELGSVDIEDVVDGACWEGDPQAFIDGLVFAGFLDRDETGLRVHDWMEFAGKLIDKRKSDAQRKRAMRHPIDVQRTSDGRPADGAGTVPYSTVPNPTEQNKTEEKSREEAEEVLLLPIELVNEPAPKTAKAPPVKPRVTSKPKYNPAAFEQVLQSYPSGFRETRSVIIERWDRLHPSVDEINAMLVFIEGAKQTDRWRGEFIKQFKVFLSERTWEDDLSGYADRKKNGRMGYDPARDIENMAASMQSRNFPALTGGSQ